jgi:thymidylate kinase
MQRQAARGNAKDYFESQKAEFYQNLVDGYRELSTIFPERILKISAEKNATDVTKEIVQDLERFIS